jgi:hypothetical protein
VVHAVDPHPGVDLVHGDVRIGRIRAMSRLTHLAVVVIDELAETAHNVGAAGRPPSSLAHGVPVEAAAAAVLTQGSGRARSR